MIISQEALTPVERSSENRDKRQSELPHIDPVRPSTFKGAAVDQILKCPGPAAHTPELFAPTEGVKTTNIKNTSDSAPAETTKKKTLRFVFPNVKGQGKS